jgi:hypothetical protein
MTRLRNLFAALAWPLLLSGLVAAQEFKAPLLDHAGRMANFEQHLEMRSGSPYKEYKWKHIGPLSMCGRVTDIAKPLDRPSTFYISTASGGVWKTENEGTTWVPIFEDAPSASTGTIAVDPQNSNTLWVGTGESNIFRSSMAGTGLYKSTDGGEPTHRSNRNSSARFQHGLRGGLRKRIHRQPRARDLQDNRWR